MTLQILDSAWIAAHPLPVHGEGTNKNTRGHVVVIGGGRSVPGAPRLTAEGALRAGAGKVQVATIASAAMPLGVAMPEIGVIPLDEDSEGEIGGDAAGRLRSALERCDTVVIGPGMMANAAVDALVDAVRAASAASLILDAAAIAASERAGRSTEDQQVILTPNHDEMGRLMACEVEVIRDNAEPIAREAAERFGATVVLKGETTLIATADGDLLHYAGGGVGLATAGSGDVLAGAIAGLLSRGASPLTASGWGVWLHGQSGRRLANDPGPIGFLARELPGEFPLLLPQ
ncbi:MAG: NAD(P)H-hydrate dehydratase [Pseudomonadota bacterium]